MRRKRPLVFIIAEARAVVNPRRKTFSRYMKQAFRIAFRVFSYNLSRSYLFTWPDTFRPLFTDRQEIRKKTAKREKERAMFLTDVCPSFYSAFSPNKKTAVVIIK